MIRFVCDICKTPTNDTEFVLPIYKNIIMTLVDGSVYCSCNNKEINRQVYNLCEVCKHRLANYIGELKGGAYETCK